MKPIDRRLRRLEDRARPSVNERGETLADVIRARRKRRLAEAGLLFEERPKEFLPGARSRNRQHEVLNASGDLRPRLAGSFRRCTE